MSYVATPGELRDWGDLLSPLPPDRIGPIKQLLAEVVGECRVCDGPIRRCDPRRLAGGSLVHVSCTPPGAEEQLTRTLELVGGSA